MKSEKWLGIHDRRHKSPCQAVYDVCGLFPVQIDLKILSHKKEHNKEGTAILNVQSVELKFVQLHDDKLGQRMKPQRLLYNVTFLLHAKCMIKWLV